MEGYIICLGMSEGGHVLGRRNKHRSIKLFPTPTPTPTSGPWPWAVLWLMGRTPTPRRRTTAYPSSLRSADPLRDRLEVVERSLLGAALPRP